MPKRKKSKKKKAKKKYSRKKRKIRRIAKAKKTYKKKSKSKKIEVSIKEQIIKTRPEWIKRSLANKSQYQKKYSESIKNNNTFWKKEGKRITWIKPYKKIKDVKYSSKEVKIKWFEDETLNSSTKTIDRNP